MYIAMVNRSMVNGDSGDETVDVIVKTKVYRGASYVIRLMSYDHIIDFRIQRAAENDSFPGISVLSERSTRYR